MGSDDGLTLFRVRDQRLVSSERLTTVRFVKALAVGDFTHDGTEDVACISGRSLFVTLLPGNRTGGLGDPIEVELESRPLRLTGNLLTRDAKPNLLVLHENGISSFVPGNGRRFRTTEILATPTATAFAVADINYDDIADLVVAGPERILRAHGNTEGSFGDLQELDESRNPRQILATDLDQDGHTDLLVIDDEGLTLYPLRVGPPIDESLAATATLGEARRLWSSPTLSEVQTADVNNDGQLDIAFTDPSRGAVTFLVGTASGDFETGDAYATGRTPEGILLGDFSRDGNVDAVVLNNVGDSATFLPGTGDGTFRSSSSLLADARDLAAIAVADFNGDTHLDLAVGSEGDGTVLLFTGDGGGRFSLGKPVRAGRQPRALVAAAFRSDAAADLAVADFGADQVIILHHDAEQGLRTAQHVTVGAGPTAIVSASFFHENRLDLAVANSLSNTVTILRNDGTGHFEAVEDIPVGSEPNFLLVGDATRDGRPDLLVGNNRSNEVTVLPGTEEGFGAPRTDQLDDRARPLVAEDLDGDGHVDLVMTDEENDAVQILPGTGPGTTFGPPITVPTGPHPHKAAAGDFDEDGLPDLAVLHRKTRTVSILINTTRKRGN